MFTETRYGHMSNIQEAPMFYSGIDLRKDNCFIRQHPTYNSFVMNTLFGSGL